MNIDQSGALPPAGCSNFDSGSWKINNNCCCQQVDPCHAELLQISRGVPGAHSAAGQLVFTSLAGVENKLVYCEFHQSDRGD